MQFSIFFIIIKALAFLLTKLHQKYHKPQIALYFERMLRTFALRSWKMIFLLLYTSSHQRCTIEKGVLRNFTKFTGNHLCQSLFFNKVADFRPKYLRNTFHRTPLEDCFLFLYFFSTNGRSNDSSYKDKYFYILLKFSWFVAISITILWLPLKISYLSVLIQRDNSCNPG